jgi:hypothetical protein
MNKRRTRPVGRLRYIWGWFASAARRNHDPFLVYSMASFNFGGGWRELLLKASVRNA